MASYWDHFGPVGSDVSVLLVAGVSRLHVFGLQLCGTGTGALEYIKKGMSAVLLSLLVGGTISTWTAARTDLSIIYYGLRYIKPDTFLMAAFFLNLLLSPCCGTA